jgi:SAM-dependent methyltransferase
VTLSRSTLKPSYFRALYTRDDDPWCFATSAYEKRKYRATLDAMTRPHYERGFEVGCSIGVLTRDLATRCHALLAVDVVEKALTAAAARCSDRPSVMFRRMVAPDELPDDNFDLILLSEVAYYWTLADLNRMVDWMQNHLVTGGELVLVHWRGVTDYPTSGDTVHEVFVGNAAFDCLSDHVKSKYRLSVLQRR